MAEIKGEKELIVKLNSLQNIIPALRPIMKEQAELVRAAAVRLCPVNHGELRGSIYTEVEGDGKTVRGVVYTNNDHAAYVEFGTGPVGQGNHEGTSPNVNVTYVQEGWWFPGSEIDPADADRYGWFSMEAEDGTKLYHTNGQPAQPYMYPALKNMETKVKTNLRLKLKKMIDEEAGK